MIIHVKNKSIKYSFSAYSILLSLSFLLPLLYTYMTSLSNAIYRKSIIWKSTLVIGVMLMAICGLMAKKRYSENSFHIRLLVVDLWWILVAILAFYKNQDIKSGVTTSYLILIVGIAMVLIISRLERWQDIAIRILYLFTWFHIIFGFYFLLNSNRYIQSIVPLLGLNDFYYNKLIVMLNSGYMVGLTSHYSIMGIYMCIGLIVMVFYSLNKNDGKLNLISIISILISVTALFLTGKRAHLIFGIMSVLITYLFFYAAKSSSKKIKRLIFLCIFLVVGYLIISSLPQFSAILERFKISDNADDVTNGRVDQLWTPAIILFKQKPWLGIGWRGFMHNYLNYSAMTEAKDVHNIYLQLLCETGIIGFVIVTGLLVYNYCLTFKLIRKIQKLNQNLGYLPLSFAMQTFFLIYGVTGNPLYDIQCLYPYLICCGIVYHYKRNSILLVKDNKNENRYINLS